MQFRKLIQNIKPKNTKYYHYHILIDKDKKMIKDILIYFTYSNKELIINNNDNDKGNVWYKSILISSDKKYVEDNLIIQNNKLILIKTEFLNDILKELGLIDNIDLNDEYAICDALVDIRMSQNIFKIKNLEQKAIIIDLKDENKFSKIDCILI